MLREKLKALIAKMLSERFSFSSSMKEFRRTRRLRFETLETRRLLSANTILEVPDESNTKITEVFGENRTICSAISFSDAVLEEMESEGLFQEASECKYLSEKTVEVNHEDSSEVVKEDFQEPEMLVVAFSELCKEELFAEENAESDEVDVQDLTNGEVIHVWAPSLVYSATGALRHVMWNEESIAFLERSGLQGSGGFSEGESFLSVTTPDLEYSFEGRITFSGDAIIGRDYDVYLSNGESLTSFNHETFTYSGGGSTLIIVPRNDNYHEPTETVEILFEEYYPYPSGGGFDGSGGSDVSGGSGGSSESDVVYEFEYETNSVSFQIIDDDQWRVEIIPGQGENGHLLEPCAGGLVFDDVSGSFIVQRGLNATGEGLLWEYPDYTLDDSYQIMVELALGGEAESRADYVFCSSLEGGLVAPTLTLNRGVTSREIWVQAVYDSVFEMDESVSIGIDDVYIGAHNYGVDFDDGNVVFTIHQAPEFVKSLDESTPLIVDDDLVHSWEIADKSYRTTVSRLQALANSGNLRYSIDSGNERNFYSIDEETGVISTTSEYDAALVNDADALSTSTTLVIRVADLSAPFGGNEFCDIVTVKLGELSYIRIYDANQPANRCTRTPRWLENDARTAFEDNRRSDFENGRSGIVLTGYDEDMHTCEIKIEVGVDESVRDRLLWQAVAANCCTIEGASSGNFSQGNTVSVIVNPNARIRRELGAYDDLIIWVGFDSNNDGFLSGDECERRFVNSVIGRFEYLECRTCLNGLRTIPDVCYPVAFELLDIFMGDMSSLSATSCRPYLLEYGGGNNGSGYSQSNGMGIDMPGLTSGYIDSYSWNSDSLMAEKICESEQFIKGVVNAIYNQALCDSTEYYQVHPEEGAHDFSFSDVTVNLSYVGLNDLAMALGHCQASLNVSISTSYDGSCVYFGGISVTGLCSDLYDFETLLGLNLNNELGEKLTYAASAIQIGHRRGVREEGEIFRVETSLDVVYTPEFLVRLDDRDSIITSLIPN